MLKRVLLLLLVSACSFSLYAQQMLTRFAVVDLARVYTAFFMESREVREFEERSARVQADIDRMTREIQELNSRRIDAVMAGNQTEALRLESEISGRTDFLRDFHATRTAELERQRRQLAQSPGFLSQVHDEIRFIAEREGFSMVLNLSDNRNILWFSPTVDITDRLIQNLRARR